MLNEKYSKAKINKSNKSVLLLISPIYISIISVLSGIIMTFYPKNRYEELIFEPNFIFLDSKVYLLMIICILSFLTGILLSYKITKINTNILVEFEKNVSRRFIIFQLMILIVSLIISCYYIYSLFKNIPNIMSMILSGSGGSYRGLAGEVFDINGTNATSILTSNIAFISYSFYNYGKYSNIMTKLARNFIRFLTAVSIILFVLACILAQARYLLMPFVTCIFIHTVYKKYNDKSINIKKIFKYSAIFLIMIFVIFNFITRIRYGNKGASFATTSLVGYTVASYNRLSAVISGNLVLPNAGNGFYILKMFWYPSIIRRYVDVYKLGNFFGLNLPPSTDENFLLQFSSIGSAGLNTRYNWCTAFGDVFSDLGWFSFIYFLFYGIISWVVFRSFIKNKTVGIIVYPIIIFSILFWLGSNYIVDGKFLINILTAMLISIIEKVFRINNKVRTT